MIVGHFYEEDELAVEGVTLQGRLFREELIQKRDAKRWPARLKRGAWLQHGQWDSLPPVRRTFSEYSLSADSLLGKEIYPQLTRRSHFINNPSKNDRVQFWKNAYARASFIQADQFAMLST